MDGIIICLNNLQKQLEALSDEIGRAYIAGLLAQELADPAAADPDLVEAWFGQVCGRAGRALGWPEEKVRRLAVDELVQQAGDFWFREVVEIFGLEATAPWLGQRFSLLRLVTLARERTTDHL